MIRWIGVGSGLIVLTLLTYLLIRPDPLPSTPLFSSTWMEEETMSKTATVSTRLGEFEIEFFPDKAPRTVQSFQKLAADGFYDGTTFHRVLPGFMIQGGCPHSRDPEKRGMHGTGGPGYRLKAEFNDRRHERGVVSMARSADPDSAGSQFFVMVAGAPHLDGKYTAFGQVIQGMDVVDKIVSERRDSRDNPLEPIAMKVRLNES